MIGGATNRLCRRLHPSGGAENRVLYFADKSDGGWTQAFDEARPKIEKALDMPIPFVENVPESQGRSPRRPSASFSAATT